MKSSNILLLNHFYGLLIEMNFHRVGEDVFLENEYNEDPFIQKHLRQIKLKSAKYKALISKSRYVQLLEEVKRLKEIGFEEIKKLLNPQEIHQLQPLFHKFDELSKKDESSIAEDQELLLLLTILKEKIDKSQNE
jgi:hypothetical protein